MVKVMGKFPLYLLLSILCLGMLALGLSFWRPAAQVQAAPEAHVRDWADLLSADAESQLEQRLATLSESYGDEVYLLTIDNAEGKSSRNYADDFWDALYPANEPSGAVLLMDMDNRELYISTAGELIDVLSDNDINAILDAAIGDMAGGHYARAAEIMLSQVERCRQRGLLSEHYRIDEKELARQQAAGAATPEPNSLSATDALLAVLGALLSGGGFFIARKKAYRAQYSRLPYAVGASRLLSFQQPQDELLDSRRQVILLPKTPPPSPPRMGESSFGRSTTHVSMGGHIHGGGGRKF